jgi:hypothetical protein
LEENARQSEGPKLTGAKVLKNETTGTIDEPAQDFLAWSMS